MTLRGPVRELKLVVWDLDETIVEGVFAEHDRTVHPAAGALLAELDERGVLQALATQNEPEVMQEALTHFGWSDLFQAAKADFAPKRHKVLSILEELDISADDAAFIDDDPFERDAMQVQIPGLTGWSVAELTAHVSSLEGEVTAEARRRPDMYRALKKKRTDAEVTGDFEAFLAASDIRVMVRPFVESDGPRAVELLTRTNRMNLGSTESPAEVIRLQGGVDAPRLLVAELRDRYGDSGRCGLLRLTPTGEDAALIDSIAISCRTRARGLSLAMFVGLLSHPVGDFARYRCNFRSTGQNRPLRMLLWAAGFSPVVGTEELRAERSAVDAVTLPSWARIDHLLIDQE